MFHKQICYIYISRDDSRKETGPENPTCILIKLYAIAAVTLAARQRIRTEMEYHVDRHLYIYMYRERIRSGRIKRGSKQTRKKHGEINTGVGGEKKGRGKKRWREIKTEREEWRPSANYLRFPATGAN